MTKITKITIGATIPCGNYSNIQPSFEVTDFDNEREGIDYALKYIKEIWERFGTTPLKEVKVKTSADKINAIL